MHGGRGSCDAARADMLRQADRLPDAGGARRTGGAADSTGRVDGGGCGGRRLAADEGTVHPPPAPATPSPAIGRVASTAQDRGQDGRGVGGRGRNERVDSGDQPEGLGAGRAGPCPGRCGKPVAPASGRRRRGRPCPTAPDGARVSGPSGLPGVRPVRHCEEIVGGVGHERRFRAVRCLSAGPGSARGPVGGKSGPAPEDGRVVASCLRCW